MAIGSKIRGIVNTVGRKSGQISSLGRKGAKFIGRFDKSAGDELNHLAKDAEIAGQVAKDVGDIGTKTGTFKKGGLIPGRAPTRAQFQTMASMAGPVSRTGMTHLATAGLGASAKLLSQTHEQLRRRDVVTEGGRLTRGAAKHLRSYR